MFSRFMTRSNRLLHWTLFRPDLQVMFSRFITCSRAARFVLRASFSCRMLSTCSWLTALWLATCSTSEPQAGGSRGKGTEKGSSGSKEKARKTNKDTKKRTKQRSEKRKKTTKRAGQGRDKATDRETDTRRFLCQSQIEKQTFCHIKVLIRKQYLYHWAASLHTSV